jgi:serine/threonine protein kinase
VSSATGDVKTIFGRAREIVSPAERAAYLAEACGDNAELRAEVEALLQAEGRMPGEFLNRPEHSEGETSVHEPATAGPGARIGPYKLLQRLGVGGMGVVWMAEQQEPVRRKVALKIIRQALDSKQVIVRFEAERQAHALMDHLNIAKMLDAGTTDDGRPYFAMELVHGVPITKYCDDNQLTPRERLELFVPVCQAIQHAHTKGIIHRDIKPRNILVTLYDGKPVPKVIDFGIAKAIDQRLTDKTMFTEYGVFLGTAEYMPPEQAEMSALGVDTRSDIYSLGVLLYELLTGTTPLESSRLREASITDVIRMIKEVEPPRPSAKLSTSVTLSAIAAARKTEPAVLAKLVKGDLDWIVMKCLEKDRTRRYETASDLARDVRNYLADDPVTARPPSPGYRLRKFTHKHRKVLATVAAFILLVLIGVVVSTWQAMALAAAFVLLLLLGMVVSTWLAMRATLAGQREREAARQMQAERDQAQLALTRQVAARLEGEVRQLAVVGDSIASTLAQRADWQESQLIGWLSDLLRKDDRIHGLTLAFEPFEFDKSQEEYCLYVWRSPRGISPKHLRSPDYRYREWDWYCKPREQQRPLWVGPFMDLGGGDVPMVSYAVPLHQQGRCVGAMTVDLPVEYFKKLWRWLAELNLGPHSYGFVISEAGAFISHPRYEMPQNIVELEGVTAGFAALARRMLNRETGRGTAIDPSTGKRSAFLFAPVSATGWSVVAVVEETAEAT